LGSQFTLNLIGVDDSCEVSAVHDVSVDVISVLFSAFSFVGTEGVVQSSEGILSEDAESTKVTTWGELEDIES